MYKQWLANPNRHMVEEYVSYFPSKKVYWLTKRVPMTSVSLPLVHLQNSSYAEVYFTERSTDLHVLGARRINKKTGKRMFGKAACYKCRENLKMYHFCYMHIRYMPAMHYGDFGIDESICDFCDRYCVISRNRKMCYNSDNEHLADTPHPMFRFQSKM